MLVTFLLKQTFLIVLAEFRWKGLGLWVRGNPPEEKIRKFVEWSKYAGVEYWKIDGGDIKYYYASKIKNEIYPNLTLEHITGTGPVNPKWDIPGLSLRGGSKDETQSRDKDLSLVRNSLDIRLRPAPVRLRQSR